MLEKPMETERLLLRRFHADDWRAVYAYLSSPTVTAWLPEGQMTADETRAFLAENMGEEAKAWAVVLKRASTLIGHMIFHPWFAHRTYVIGWVLHQQHHGQGYAVEAARALFDYGFTTLDCHRIIATCQPENRPSYRVMEKLGMRREGHFRRCIYRGGDLWWDEYFYALLAEEWR